MAVFHPLFKMQCKRLLSRTEVKFAFTTMLAIVLFSFAESCMLFYGSESNELPSAAYGWIGNMDNMQIQIMHVFYFYLIFLVAAMAFGDSFFIDIKCGVSNAIAIRSTLRIYFTSTGLLAFIGGFLVVLIPLIVSQLLAFLVFPAIAAPNSFAGTINSPAFDSYSMMKNTENSLFPALYVNFPYVNNLVFIFYASLWAGIMALMSFVVSLFTRKSRLVVLGAPTLVFLLAFFVLPSNLALPNYLYPSTLIPQLSPVFFFAAPLVMLAMLVTLIIFAAMDKKDILL